MIKITCECKHGNRYAKSGKYQNGTHEYINFRLGDQGLAVQELKNTLERKMGTHVTYSEAIRHCIALAKQYYDDQVGL